MADQGYQPYIDPVSGKEPLPPLPPPSNDAVIDVSGPTPLPPGTQMAPEGPNGVPGSNATQQPLGGGPPEEIDVSDLAPAVHPAVTAKMKQLEQQPQAQAPAPDEIDASEVSVESGGKSKYAPMIMAEAERQGLSPADAHILVGIASHESGFDPGAKGPADPHTGHQAQGMFQQFPASVADSHGDLSTPEGQIASGVSYYKQMLDKANGDSALAVGLYNAGPNAPDKIDPRYVKSVYAAAGAQLPGNFRPLAQRIYSLSHSAQEPITYDQDSPWSFSANTLNDMTLGAGKLAMDHIHAAMYGTSPEQESALSQMYQERWMNQAGVVPQMVSAGLGFLAPDAAIAKGVMAGGRALVEAAPRIAPVVQGVLGLAGPSANRVKAGLASGARAVAGGAAFGAIDSGGDTSKSVGEQTAEGATGGALGAMVSPVAGAIGGGIRTVINAGRDDLTPLYEQAQRKVGQMLGANPTLTESPIPGVSYSLPEALDGQNSKITSWFSRVSKGSPELEAKIRNDAAARADHLANVGGSMTDWENAKASRDALGDRIGTLFNSSKQKLDLGPALKTLRDIAADPRRNKVEGFPEAMRELEDRFYKPAEKASRAKPTGTMADLTAAMPEKPTIADGKFTFPIRDDKGSAVGKIIGKHSITDGKGLLKIDLSQVDPASQRQGYATKAYDNLFKYAEREGLDVHSDHLISPQAVKLYRKLWKDGWELKRNPDAYQDGKNVKTDDRSPVYTLTNEPKNPQAEFEKSLYQQLEEASKPTEPKAPPAPKLEDQPAPIHGIRKYIQGQLDTKDSPVTRMDKEIKSALVQVKEQIDDILNQVPEARDLNQQFATAAKREDELKYVQQQRLTNARGVPTIPALQRLIKGVEQAPMRPGVLGKTGQAKSVSDQTLQGYKDLLGDLQRTDRAKISTSISGAAAEGQVQHDSGKIISGLMHASAGSLGALGTHLVGLPMGLGWAGGITASMAGKAVSAQASKAMRQAELEVLLNPKKYPPIAPGKQEVFPGFYPAVVGGQGYQGLVGPDRQRKEN